MVAEIKIHQPSLTNEEKERRMELIRKATVKFLQEVQHEKQKNQNRMA